MGVHGVILTKFGVVGGWFWGALVIFNGYDNLFRF